MNKENSTLNYYRRNSLQLAEQYNSVSFENIHKDWIKYLPKKESIVIDIGAGSGRDAVWLSEQGYKVVAVEPVVEFYTQFLNVYSETTVLENINWIVDQLPELKKLEGYRNKASLILLSAVWMHLKEKERKQAMKKLSFLCMDNGLLVISLRFGQSPDERRMYPVSIDELKLLGRQNNFKIKKISKSPDQLKRNDVFWQTVVLEKHTVNHMNNQW